MKKTIVRAVAAMTALIILVTLTGGSALAAPGYSGANAAEAGTAAQLVAGDGGSYYYNNIAAAINEAAAGDTVYLFESAAIAENEAPRLTRGARLTVSEGAVLSVYGSLSVFEAGEQIDGRCVFSGGSLEENGSTLLGTGLAALRYSGSVSMAYMGGSMSVAAQAGAALYTSDGFNHLSAGDSISLAAGSRLYVESSFINEGRLEAPLMSAVTVAGGASLKTVNGGRTWIESESVLKNSGGPVTAACGASAGTLEIEGVVYTGPGGVLTLGKDGLLSVEGSLRGLALTVSGQLTFNGYEGEFLGPNDTLNFANGAEMRIDGPLSASGEITAPAAAGLTLGETGLVSIPARSTFCDRFSNIAAHMQEESMITYYPCLQTAVNNVPEGGVVILDRDNAENALVSRSVSFTLDPDSFSFTGSVTAGKGFSDADTELTDYVYDFRAGSYAITYVLNGGVNNPKNTKTAFEVDSGTIELYDPSFPSSASQDVAYAYTFAGWYTDPAFSSVRVTEIPAGTTANVILYAKWEGYSRRSTVLTGGGERYTYTDMQTGAETLVTIKNGSANINGKGRGAEAAAITRQLNDAVKLTAGLKVTECKVELTWPAGLLLSAADRAGFTAAGVTELAVKTAAGTVTLSGAALSSAALGDRAVKLSLEKLSKSDLTPEQAAAVGEDSVYMLSVLTLYGSRQEEVLTFDGPVTISVPYTLGTGEYAGDIEAFTLEGSVRTPLDIIYTPGASGTVSFTAGGSLRFTLSGGQSWESPYIDVDDTDWYFPSVRYVTLAGIMNGTSGSTFEPRDSMTRAMLVTVLYRLSGSAAPASASVFSDVRPGQWYSDAVAWAAGNGIVGGYGNGRFGTNDPVTREQIAAILYRYAGRFSESVPKGEGTALSGFADSGKVSSWAIEPMVWACASGLITGRIAQSGESVLTPGDNATRAEVATMIMRFSESD